MGASSATAKAKNTNNNKSTGTSNYYNNANFHAYHLGRVIEESAGAGVISSTPKHEQQDLIYVSPSATSVSARPMKNSGELMKIAVIGDGGVGKSAFTIMFTQNFFVEIYDPTIDDSFRYQMTVDNNVYMLEIYDTGCTYDFEALVDQMIRSHDGFVLMYTGTSQASLQLLQKQIDKIKRVKDLDYDKDVGDISVIVCQRFDLNAEFQVLPTEMTAFADLIGTTHYLSSAKYNVNVKVVFEELCRKISAKKYPPEPSGRGRGRCGIPNEEMVLFKETGKGCCHDAVNQIVEELWKITDFSVDNATQDKWKNELTSKVSLKCMATAMSDNELKVLIAEEISHKMKGN